jgi:hypothetical protein
MEYVTYDSSGKLTGSYSQSLHPDHVAAHIEVTSSQRQSWTSFQANAARNGLEAVAPVAPPMPTVTQYTAAIQSMLDVGAQEERFDGILSACSYATSTNPVFQAQGQACVAWRDIVWATSYELMGQVEAGTMAQPTIAELLAMLPVMAWSE